VREDESHDLPIDEATASSRHEKATAAFEGLRWLGGVKM
jgi:hypothetical protein